MKETGLVTPVDSSVLCSVPILMSVTSIFSFMRRLRSSTALTAVVIARPLALKMTFVHPCSKKFRAAKT